MDTKKKLLVVDDEPASLSFFQVMFSNLGFDVETAVDGLEALDKLKRFHADLILLDNIMPRMTGWELTKKLKEDPKYQEISIIMFSALDDVKDKVAGFELGIDDYVTKPFNFSELLARVKAVLRNRELFAQIAAREARLSLAEKLNSDIKKELEAFVANMNGLDMVIAKMGSQGAEATAKMKAVREQIADLDKRFEQTLSRWEDLKKNETSLPVLVREMRKSIHQDQEQA